jgi:NADP-dependent 3-hydroxy acid dehydrogenase YdfG
MMIIRLPCGLTCRACVVVGHHTAQFAERGQQSLTGALPSELTDEDSPTYWAMDPRHLAENILYAIDQPWGVSIGDITVRATGEDFVR